MSFAPLLRTFRSLLWTDFSKLGLLETLSTTRAANFGSSSLLFANRCSSTPNGRFASRKEATMQCSPAHMTRMKLARSIHDDGTLVVVDLQPHFVRGCENPFLVANVAREVIMAKHKGWAIVLLEVEPLLLGDTLPAINRLLSGDSVYARARRRVKSGEDGSDEVIEVCRENDFSLTNFRVVGVYSDCCVEQTAVSLVEKLAGAQVRVVKRACSTNFEEKTGWEVFRKRARLKVA